MNLPVSAAFQVWKVSSQLAARVCRPYLTTVLYWVICRSLAAQQPNKQIRASPAKQNSDTIAGGTEKSPQSKTQIC